jgi:hypothetical protein
VNNTGKNDRLEFHLEYGLHSLWWQGSGYGMGVVLKVLSPGCLRKLTNKAYNFKKTALWTLLNIENNTW